MNNQITQSKSVDNEIYKNAIEISQEFLGPAAERFLNRQIREHLQKKADDLSKSDIPELARWIKVSASLLTDQKVASDFADKISSII